MVLSAKPFRPSSLRKLNRRGELKLRFFPLGRDALVEGLRAYISPTQGSVLFPAFYCNETIRAINSAGYNAHFLDTMNDLGWDMEMLAKTLSKEKISAVVICDYFGWRASRLNEVVALCRRNGVVVIRDCCHSAFSWNEHDPLSDITVFSFRKILPVRKGGALLCNEMLKDHGALLDRASRDSIGSRFADVCVRFVFEYSLFNPYMIIDFVRRFRSTTEGLNEKSAVIQGSIIPTQELLSWLNDDRALQRVVNSRVTNARNLAKLLRGLTNFRPLYSRVEAGDVPQVFPIMVSDAANLIRFLRNKGVGAVAWPGPSLPAEVIAQNYLFTNAALLNSSIVCLPIHQDISGRQLDYVGKLLREWNHRQPSITR